MGEIEAHSDHDCAVGRAENTSLIEQLPAVPSKAVTGYDWAYAIRRAAWRVLTIVAIWNGKTVFGLAVFDRGVVRTHAFPSAAQRDAEARHWKRMAPLPMGGRRHG